MSRSTNPLTRTIRSCGSALGATFVLSLFINASMLVSPLYSMQVYDRVLTSRNLGTLSVLTVIVVAFLAAVSGCSNMRAPGVLVRTALISRLPCARLLFETMLQAELSPRNRPGQQIIRDAELLRESIAGAPRPFSCDVPWIPVYVAAVFPSFTRCSAGIALIGAAALGRYRASHQLHDERQCPCNGETHQRGAQNCCFGVAQWRGGARAWDGRCRARPLVWGCNRKRRP